jgi:tetratricopeptide (TPR) repeat protein
VNLAALCLKKFDSEQQASENPMPLAQIREAAEASRFPTRDALDRWLAAAIGPRTDYLRRACWHARQAIRLSPLQGEAYIYLADLTFLDGAPEAATSALIDQALAVRPHSAVVQLAAGHSRLVAGNLDDATELFRKAFQQSGEFQRHIIELFAPQGAEFFITRFQPDVPNLQILHDYYNRLGASQEAKKVSDHLVQVLHASAKASSGERAANLWRQCAYVHRSRGERELALQCAASALAATPDDFASRRNYADFLLKEQKYADAVEHLQWCLLRYPENKKLAEDLALATSRASSESAAQSNRSGDSLR